MESILMDYLNSLKGKKIAVIGMGVSNTPLVKRMLQAGLNVRVCDKRERADFEGLPELEAKGLLSQRAGRGTVTFQNSLPEKLAMSQTLFQMDY